MGRADKKFKIITEVVGLLLSSEALVKMIGDKVFPIVAPEGTEGDFVVYQRDGFKREDTKMGRALQQSLFYITAVSEDYDRCLDIADAVFDTLEGDFANPDMRIKLEDYTEDYADKKFIQILQFSIQ